MVPKTRTVCQSVINEHKTAGHFELLLKNLSTFLSDLIRNYINENNITFGYYLFSDSTLSPFVLKMSKEIGYYVTINTLRHMAISKFLKKNDR